MNIVHCVVKSRIEHHVSDNQRSTCKENEFMQHHKITCLIQVLIPFILYPFPGVCLVLCSLEKEEQTYPSMWLDRATAKCKQYVKYVQFAWTHQLGVFRDTKYVCLCMTFERLSRIRLGLIKECFKNFKAFSRHKGLGFWPDRRSLGCPHSLPYSQGMIRQKCTCF